MSVVVDEFEVAVVLGAFGRPCIGEGGAIALLALTHSVTSTLP